MPSFERILITGSGRSGTFYTHRLLKALGVSSSHEEVYGPRGAARWPTGIHAEASWLAAPLLASVPKGTLIVHQVRNPLAVGRSFLGRKTFTLEGGETAYSEFIRKHRPEVYAIKDPRIRFLRYYLQWNRLAEAHANFCCRVEDFDVELIAALLGHVGVAKSESEIQEALDSVSTKLNSGPHGGPGFDWATLPVTRESQNFLRLAQRFGYQTF